jgi:hypothetical protein
MNVLAVFLALVAAAFVLLPVPASAKCLAAWNADARRYGRVVIQTALRRINAADTKRAARILAVVRHR